MACLNIWTRHFYYIYLTNSFTAMLTNEMSSPQNQHYISQVLLRRFSHVKQNGDWVFLYDLTDKKWNELHTSKTFSWHGYTAIQQGAENTIEGNFHKLKMIASVR